MLFKRIVCKIRPKHSKELLDYKVKNANTYKESYNDPWCIKKIFPMK